jgi:hypothetical protein
MPKTPTLNYTGHNQLKCLEGTFFETARSLINNPFYCSMKRVILQFDDKRDLRRFVMIISCNYLEMNVAYMTVICDCDDAEIELAKNAFNARVKEMRK